MQWFFFLNFLLWKDFSRSFSYIKRGKQEREWIVCPVLSKWHNESSRKMGYINQNKGNVGTPWQLFRFWSGEMDKREQSRTRFGAREEQFSAEQDGPISEPSRLFLLSFTLIWESFWLKFNICIHRGVASSVALNNFLLIIFPSRM